MPAPPSNISPYAPQYAPVRPSDPTPRQMSQGARIAVLAIILAAAIPLTAIATYSIGIIGLAICWVGIAFVAAVVFRNR